MLQWALLQFSFLQYSWYELIRPWPTWPGNILLPLDGLLVLALLRAVGNLTDRW